MDLLPQLCFFLRVATRKLREAEQRAERLQQRIEQLEEAAECHLPQRVQPELGSLTALQLLHSESETREAAEITALDSQVLHSELGEQSFVDGPIDTSQRPPEEVDEHVQPAGAARKKEKNGRCTACERAHASSPPKRGRPPGWNFPTHLTDRWGRTKVAKKDCGGKSKK